MSDAKDPQQPLQVSTGNWTGTPLTLAQYDNATMPQTPNGSTILAYQNTSSINNLGSLSVTSGGGAKNYDAQYGANAPSIVVQNYQASNVKLTNVSLNSATPIWIEMFGPGIPGQPTPVTVTPGGPGVSLPPLSATAGIATAQAQPNNMLLRLTSNTNNLTIVALVGGPQDGSGNNAYVFALNYGGPPNPAGYTNVTGSNNYTYNFNWGASSIYMANMSPSNAAPVTITLLSL